jgi:hypothetical protein
MMQTVQLTIADCQYAATVREALSRSCAWHIEAVEQPDLSCHGVMVLDELAFARLPLPLSNPGRVVLITRQEPPAPQFLAQHRFRSLCGRSPQYRAACHHGSGPAC